MELGALLQVGSHLYHIEMAVGLLNYARDLLHVEQENQLVSYPILDPWQRCHVFHILLKIMQSIPLAERSVDAMHVQSGDS